MRMGDCDWLERRMSGGLEALDAKRQPSSEAWLAGWLALRERLSFAGVAVRFRTVWVSTGGAQPIRTGQPCLVETSWWFFAFLHFWIFGGGILVLSTAFKKSGGGALADMGAWPTKSRPFDCRARMAWPASLSKLQRRQCRGTVMASVR